MTVIRCVFLAWERLVESCSPRCLVERDEELLDWEALVFYFTLNLVFLCHRVWLTADHCQQITSLYCYGSISPSGLERNQRKKAQSFWITAIKRVSGIQLIRENEALACDSLARGKRHKTLTQTGKHASVKGYRHGERNVSVGEKAGLPGWIRFKFEFFKNIPFFISNIWDTFINICWY